MLECPELEILHLNDCSELHILDYTTMRGAWVRELLIKDAAPLLTIQTDKGYYCCGLERFEISAWRFTGDTAHLNPPEVTTATSLQIATGGASQCLSFRGFFGDAFPLYLRRGVKPCASLEHIEVETSRTFSAADLSLIASSCANVRSLRLVSCSGLIGDINGGRSKISSPARGGTERTKKVRKPRGSHRKQRSSSLDDDELAGDNEDTEALGRRPRSQSEGSPLSPSAEPLDAALSEGEVLPVVFHRLESLSIRECHRLQSLVISAPHLVELHVAHNSKLCVLRAQAASLAFLDVTKCTTLAAIGSDGENISWPTLRTAIFYECRSLHVPFFTRLVDSSRALTYMDIVGTGAVALGNLASQVEPTVAGIESPTPADSGAMRRGGGSGGKKKRGGTGGIGGGGAGHGGGGGGVDPTRVKQKTHVGIDKLAKGRPDLRIIRTQKQHERAISAASMMRDYTRHST